MLWLYLSFYQLQLDDDSLLRQQAHAHSTEPTVVYEPTKNEILQACQVAISHNIQPGMGLAAASAMCSKLRLLAYDESLATHRLHDLALSLYPVIGEIALNSPHGLYLRLDRTTTYYGCVESLWAAIQYTLAKTPYQYTFASAYSPQAAQILAERQCNQLLQDEHAIKQALASVPLQSLHIDTKTSNKLSRVGMRTLGDVFAIPTHEMGRRFDKEVLVYLATLRGERFPTLSMFAPPEHFSHHIVLPYEVSISDKLLIYLTQQVKALSRFLLQRNQQTTSLSIRFHYREQQPDSLSITAAIPQHCAQQWLMLIALKLEQFKFSEPVTEITLSADALVELQPNSNDFFSPQHNTIAQAQLVGKLIARLGASSVSQPVYVNEHRVTLPASPNTTKGTCNAPLHYPLHVMPYPIVLTEPTRVLYGPERLSTGWWDEHSLQRDYYVAQASHGGYLWVFKDSQGQWFQHGWFG